MRKVINKMVTEEDLIRTVATAYSHGWRQVKLYFMCGLPTETDEDVLEIADLAKKVIAKGREVSGRNDIRCTVSIGGFVPKPHTPFQWAAQLDHETTDERLKKLRDDVRADKQYGRAIGFRYHDGKPRHHRGTAVPRRPPGRRGHRGGLARRRPVRRLERALLLRPLGGGRRARRCRHRRRPRLVHHARARATPRCCPGTTSTPASTRTGSGRTGRTPSTPTRRRGRGLPLDPVLRLRRLPRDGHRDPDRPDRPEAAPALRGVVVRVIGWLHSRRMARIPPDQAGLRPTGHSGPHGTGAPLHPRRCSTTASRAAVEQLREWTWPQERDGLEGVDGGVQVALEVPVALAGSAVEQSPVELDDERVDVGDVAVDDARRRDGSLLACGTGQAVCAFDPDEELVLEHRAGAFGEVTEDGDEPVAAWHPRARLQKPMSRSAVVLLAWMAAARMPRDTRSSDASNATSRTASS